MSCSHVDTCPLFPKLHSSLEGWKKAYCNHEDKWLECARYKTGLEGKPVPLALLPNGKVLGLMAQPEGTGATRGSSNRTQGAVALATPASGVAVLDDEAAGEVLDEASSGVGRFFKRFKGLFGGPK